MNSDPRVSVIIPTYNRRHHLGTAVRSVLAQTFAAFELLVVDDGSTDGTAALIGGIADRRVRSLQRPHRGISATMNDGVRAARGRYVARLDSDDRWEPDLLATLVPLLDQHPRAAVVYGRGRLVDEHGRPLAATHGLPLRFPGDALRSLVYDDCTCNIALLSRRECLIEAGLFDERLRANEDWDMWLRVARRHEFVFVDRTLAWIQLHQTNLTAASSPIFADVLATRTVPLDTLFADPQLPPAVRAMRPTAYANVHLWRGLRWLGARHYRSACAAFAKALATSDHRMVMAMRIAWFVAAAPVLDRLPLGRRAWIALVRLRRR